MILSILILNYNTEKLIIDCLNSLIDQFHNELNIGKMEILVGDNSSSDNSIKTIKNFASNKKNILPFENKENLGFSKGHNALSKKARGKFLFFLNSDTTVADRGLLEMVKFLAHNEDVGILGARMINPDGSSQSSCGVFYTLFPLCLMLFGAERFVRFIPKNIRMVDWVSGGAMMVRKSTFEQLGGFDEHFFMYVEDMELCLRARKSGQYTYFYPKASVAHKKLGSSNRAYAILNIYRGICYFYRKHQEAQYAFAVFMLKLKALVSIVVSLLTGNMDTRRIYQSVLKEMV